MFCIAIPGLWNWKLKAENELMPDFDRIALDGRLITINPDNDWLKPNRKGERKNLRQAVERLAYLLIDKGAKVYWRELPQGDQKVGLDDNLCKHSIDELKRLPVCEIRKPTLDKKKKPTQGEIILKQTKDITLFHDENKDAYAFLENQAVLLRSKKMKQWLSRLLYKAVGKAANSETLSNVIGVLEGKAIYDNPEKILYNRVACKSGVFWYDLGCGQAVKITDAGWVVVEAPIIFKRYSHQQTQVTPIGGGDPWKIFEFLNIEDEHKLLVLVYIVSCFIPDIPHPIFYPHGAQGAGKTTLGRVIKRICDPSNIETLITPRDLNQLVQTIAHHHICIFDNLSNLPQWMSDILAQACTGGGFTKRQLYTDDEDVIYKVKRCIGLNGINLTISKPDLMDRSILLHLDRIDKSKRIDEEELWESFETARPKILGGIFDVLSKAMRIYIDVKLPYLPRMADFAKWGYAIAEAMSGRGNEFLQSYQQNVERQNEEVVQGNTLAQTVLTFMNDKETWDGTVSQAWEELNEIANPNKQDGTFPKTSRTLRKHLERIKTNLMDLGVTFQFGQRTKEGYPITFQKGMDFGSFGTPKRNAMSDKDLAGEPKVNQNEANEFGTPFNTPLKPKQNKELYQNVANVPNLHTYRNDLKELEI